MPLMFALLLGAQAPPTPIWQLQNGLAISRVSRGGRIPFPQDDLLSVLEASPSEPEFKPGDVIKGANAERKWEPVKANDKGQIPQPPGGYIQAVVPSDTDKDGVLTIVGDSAVYVNGELRPGDVYGFGYLSLPVHLHAGDNTLLIASGRGDVSARIDAPKAPQQFNLADPTLPDVLTNDHGKLWGAVVVLNSTGKSTKNLKLQATIDGQSVTTALPEIGPYTLRKVPFQFPVVAGEPKSKQKLDIALVSEGKSEDTGSLSLDVVDPFTTHKRTFVSGVDGSVQYFGVVPAKKPSKSNALVLTLHGASVEGIGQARAYQAKDWCTIVAATNRRPYGFDWEEIGRLDALEVLDHAKHDYPHDPARVDLTGHSMGGHGTWSIGTMYPNLFAAIAPSAGWISFASYAGGYSPANPSPTEQVFLDAAEPSDTLGRVRNTLEGETYILHGDVDDNVPVTEARTMKKALTDIGAKFEYHEQPGANHWWGNQCVDWPPLFAMLQDARLKPVDDPSPIDFTTPNPQINSSLRWVTIYRQAKAGLSSVQAKVDGGVMTVMTTNVEALELRAPKAKVTSLVVDGAPMSPSTFPLRLEKVRSWTAVTDWKKEDKSPARSGGFKLAFDHDMVFVYGTAAKDSAELYAFARYMSETLYYRGNATADIVSDAEFLKNRKYKGRNVILFGNADDNLAWKFLLDRCPIQVTHRGITTADRRGLLSEGANRSAEPGITGSDLAALITYPLPGSTTGLVAAFAVTGSGGIDVLERLPMLASGPAYPDWTIFDAAKEPTSGARSVIATGNFGPDWSLARGYEVAH